MKEKNRTSQIYGILPLVKSAGISLSSFDLCPKSLIYAWMCFKKEIPTPFSYRAISNKPLSWWKKYPQTASTLRVGFMPYTLSISFGQFQLLLSLLCGHWENSCACFMGCFRVWVQPAAWTEFPCEWIKCAIVTRILEAGTRKCWNEWGKVWWSKHPFGIGVGDGGGSGSGAMLSFSTSTGVRNV